MSEEITTALVDVIDFLTALLDRERDLREEETAKLSTLTEEYAKIRGEAWNAALRQRVVLSQALTCLDQDPVAAGRLVREARDLAEYITRNCG